MFLCGASIGRYVKLRMTLAATRIARRLSPPMRFSPASLEPWQRPRRRTAARIGSVSGYVIGALQHVVDGERLVELRMRVVHGVPSGSSPIPRRSGVASFHRSHVVATERRVNRHEAAVGTLRLRTRRRFDALTELRQYLEILFGAGHVPSCLEDRHRLGLVGDVHFLGAECQRNVARARLDTLQREMKCRASGRTGILDIEHGIASMPILLNTTWPGIEIWPCSGPLVTLA
jgi:hypothetical protein